MRRTILGLTVLAALTAVDLVAQYPGQYPPGGYPPGGYPPGSGSPNDRYPSGPGIPFPGRKKKTTAKAETEPLQQLSGILRQLNDARIVMTAEDTRTLDIRRSGDTKFNKDNKEIKASELHPGDHITVEARQDDEGFLYAATVTFTKAGTPAERASASQPVQAVELNPSMQDERPKLRRAGSKPKEDTDEEKTAESAADARPTATPAPPAPEQERVVIPVVEAKEPIDDSDPGVPRLQRGRPVEREAQPENHKAQPQTREVAVNTPPKLPPATTARIPAPEAPTTDPRIEKARAAAMNFTATLPSYVCKEQIARFQSITHKVNWQPIDIVSAEVVYEGGRERYQNLEIDGKPVKKKMEQLSGAWSTGEFGTVLVDLFSPATDAQFRYRGVRRIAGRDADVFNYEVDRENSHWHIQVASQSVQPAYKGGIWVDKETSRVLRIEMEAAAIPEAFPQDKIESATDYQFIRIGDSQFLLPVHSEVLSCQRGTSECSRNVIDFRNYHKFEGESTIKFEDKAQ